MQLSESRPSQIGARHIDSAAKSNLNVLHVIPGIARRYGGPSEVILSLVAALNEIDGVRAGVATTDADGAGGRLAPADVPADIPLHVLRHSFSERWKVSLGLRNWLRQHAREYDLIHIHAIWSFVCAAAARAAERSAVPYIVRPAGMLSDYSWGRRGWTKRAYWRLVEHRTIQNAAAFHATSEAEAAEIRAVRPDARVFIIPNGVDETAFAAPRDPASLRRRCGSPTGDLPIVLFLSRLHPKKGIVDRLLPAMTTMRSPAFLVIAGGEDPHAPGYADEIRRSIDRLALNERVAMLGPVDANERWSMFDGADAFVLPSHAENFGIVVAEAMARGCPVVVTDSVQSCSHVRAAGCGEVIPGGVSELAAALDRIVSQPDLRRDFGVSGRAYAERHFRWTNIAQQVRRMYDDCLAHSPPAAG